MFLSVFQIPDENPYRPEGRSSPALTRFSDHPKSLGLSEGLSPQCRVSAVTRGAVFGWACVYHVLVFSVCLTGVSQGNSPGRVELKEVYLVQLQLPIGYGRKRHEERGHMLASLRKQPSHLSSLLGTDPSLKNNKYDFIFTFCI